MSACRFEQYLLRRGEYHSISADVQTKPFTSRVPCAF
jgi:hypothetical protein